MGLPHCFAVKDLLLQSAVLDGTFRGMESITLGSGITFQTNANVFLRTPKVIIIEQVIPQSGVTVTVDPEPCEN